MRGAQGSSLSLSAAVPMKHPNPAVLVTYHPEYQAFNPVLVERTLAKATELNVGYLRTDVRWCCFMPDGVRVDPDALTWYRSFLGRAQEYGFRNLVVLSTPPGSVMRGPVSARMEAWLKFVENVVAELGQYCGFYQFMNEPNSPVYSFFPRSEAPRAVEAGAALIKARYPAADVAINICMDVWGWRGYLTGLLMESGSAVAVVGLDHYPGTWTIGRQNRWRDVYHIAECIKSAMPGSVWFKRRLAVMETGFATNTWLRGEERQAQYFADLANVVTSLRQAYGMEPMIGIYELCDSDSCAFLDPEAHFGLLTSDLKAKRAFSTVQNLIASLM